MTLIPTRTSAIWKKGPLLFLLLGSWFLICLANWLAIDRVNFEIGDFAANSILIQDAKSFRLLVGNYSRVGFNHPGPAILYVLAFGELIFFDALHIVKSALSGQLVAAALYTAVWLTVLFRLFQRITNAPKVAMLALSGFILATASFEPATFTSIWFPHLYYFPFAVALVAASRLAAGQCDSLLALAIGAGFAINGHVSFIPIMGVIGLAIILYNVFVYRGTDRSLFSRSFLLHNGRRLAWAVVVCSAFLLPLVVETIRHFPGPILAYAKFGGHRDPNTFEQAVGYMSVYWGGTKFLLFPVLVALVIRSIEFDSGQVRDSVKALLFMMLAATVALLMYARFGIDLLDQIYIGLFYFSVPALLVAILLICVYQLARTPSRNRLAVLATLGMGVGAFSMIDHPSNYGAQYTAPGIPALYDRIRALGGGKRVVLDLDDLGPEWGTVWTELAGVEAYAKRRHEDPMCINKAWHILFTPKVRCGAEETAENPRFVVRGSSPAPGLAPVVDELGLAMFRYVPPPIIDQGFIDVATKRAYFRDYLLGKGWSVVEGPFVWSESQQAKLELILVRGFSGTLSLSLGGFFPPGVAYHDVKVLAGNDLLTSARILPQARPQTVNVPLRNLQSDRIVITVQIDHPVSPKSVGMSDDARLLGVSLYGLEVRSE